MHIGDAARKMDAKGNDGGSMTGLRIGFREPGFKLSGTVTLDAAACGWKRHRGQSIMPSSCSRSGLFVSKLQLSHGQKVHSSGKIGEPGHVQ